MPPPIYPTPLQLLEAVLELAEQHGYDMTRPQHPEDTAVNFVPLLEAYAAGWGQGLRVGRGLR